MTVCPDCDRLNVHACDRRICSMDDVRKDAMPMKFDPVLGWVMPDNWLDWFLPTPKRGPLWFWAE
jgi:hypothetical protein